jgi:hypothetical protein
LGNRGRIDAVAHAADQTATFGQSGIRREGLSFKKKPFRPSPASAGGGQGRVDPRRLVFIEETWAKTNVGLLRGWAPRGQRLPGQVPYGHWKTMTFLAAL